MFERILLIRQCIKEFTNAQCFYKKAHRSSWGHDRSCEKYKEWKEEYKKLFSYKTPWGRNTCNLWENKARITAALNIYHVLRGSGYRHKTTVHTELYYKQWNEKIWKELEEIK